MPTRVPVPRVGTARSIDIGDETMPIHSPVDTRTAPLRVTHSRGRAAAPTVTLHSFSRLACVDTRALRRAPRDVEEPQGPPRPCQYEASRRFTRPTRDARAHGSQSHSRAPSGTVVTAWRGRPRRRPVRVYAPPSRKPSHAERESGQTKAVGGHDWPRSSRCCQPRPRHQKTRASGGQHAAWRRSSVVPRPQRRISTKDAEWRR
jgi:hypothetical protein